MLIFSFHLWLITIYGLVCNLLLFIPTYQNCKRFVIFSMVKKIKTRVDLISTTMWIKIRDWGLSYNIVTWLDKRWYKRAIFFSHFYIVRWLLWIIVLVAFERPLFRFANRNFSNTAMAHCWPVSIIWGRLRLWTMVCDRQ